ncbi:glycoside hydrolase family 3 N-terminal domain-containing protein [Actinoplanes sp. NPDC051411]|uniref:glycoside hydrolase family 3 N-terminal domain-containing protein n=1 Tax=Actinoplanes sp. NPDC051411 TaxID=3155522 RepID=UPI003415478F
MTFRTAVDKRRWWIGGALAVIVAAVLGVSRIGGADDPKPAAAPASAAVVPSVVPSSAPSPSPSPPPSSKPPADCVTQTVDGMSLFERAGQVLMIGTAVDAPSGLGDTVARYHLGGVFLHGRSTEPASQLRSGIAGLQKRSPVPLLISLDQEGGQVQTLKGADFPRLPSALKLGGESTATIRDTTADSAHRLAGIGVTIDLAPVADTVPAGLGDGNPPIGGFDRQFGSDPKKVAASIRTVVGASQDAGVMTVLKHFPGLGRVHANTDVSAKAVDSTTDADDPYLQPFAAGIQAGSAGVMISSASYPHLDPKNIAAFSPSIITGLLRDKLGFQGLVMSDDLGAAVAVAGTPAGQRAVRFVAAGGDVVLSIKPSDAAPMASALMTKARGDAAFKKRLTDAATHVLRAKAKAGILSCG